MALQSVPEKTGLEAIHQSIQNSQAWGPNVKRDYLQLTY